MKPEAEQYLVNARQHLADAKAIASHKIYHIAAREAYLAGYHAAEAYLYEILGKGAKTHSGLRSEFARLAKDNPAIDQHFVEFLGRAYELKSLADYGPTPSQKILAADAARVIEIAEGFIICISQLISTSGA